MVTILTSVMSLFEWHRIKEEADKLKRKNIQYVTSIDEVWVIHAGNTCNTEC